jgi:hypothetical protein
MPVTQGFEKSSHIKSHEPVGVELFCADRLRDYDGTNSRLYNTWRKEKLQHRSLNTNLSVC